MACKENPKPIPRYYLVIHPQIMKEKPHSRQYVGHVSNKGIP
jgi:hypothetical protein